MRRVMRPEIQFHHADSPESEEKLAEVYELIFRIAKENIAKKLKQKELKHRCNSLELTTKRHQSNVCVAERTL